MRKLIESTFVTLDGVISSPEKWGSPYWDEEHAAYGDALFSSSDALLLGRVTYEAFAGVWPKMEQAGDEDAARMNALPKYVASRTLTEATWNATILEGDVAKEIARLKELPGQNILKYGTGELDRMLLEHKLVDEYHFWMFPAVAGSGQRLLDGIDTTHLTLVRTAPFASGIVVLVYEPKR
ncbi:dihydrofolate reductase family protein [Planotetraspora phitsanulokensis]|uniref:Pyrimidine reductase n=1 Tax=Planotetraspora phitsanulokensis TaxID=575192 RepID=A0A8J3U4M3_9ACTN|nr:dihydrofolate reductase family protein [Planotetraspora phitsanulokensis]GII35969.1 pyrimidine reductase [Planotetraspora phitsanulokensis]